MIERWTQWKPIDNLSSKYYIESFSLNNDGFILTLIDAQDQKQKIVVDFAQAVSTFRRINGDLRHAIIENLYQYYGKKFFDEWTFFKVINSHYIEEIMEESWEIFEREEFTNIVFVTPNSILELTIRCDPNILFIA